MMKTTISVIFIFILKYIYIVFKHGRYVNLFLLVIDFGLK